MPPVQLEEHLARRHRQARLPGHRRLPSGATSRTGSGGQVEGHRDLHVEDSIVDRPFGRERDAPNVWVFAPGCQPDGSTGGARP